MALQSAEAQENCFVYESHEGDQRVLVALNFSAKEQKLGLPFAGTGKFILSTRLDRAGEANLADLSLRPNEGCIIAL